MKNRLLLWYQTGIAASDTVTGICLLFAPLFTLKMMHLHALESSAIFLSWIGVFVTSVGVACAYGVRLMACKGCSHRLETVWLLTAVTRGLVAVFLFANLATGNLATAWSSVAVFDATCSVIQCIGLRRGWLREVVR